MIDILGPWKAGYAFGIHTLKSVYIGDDEYGHPRFQTDRSPIGQSLYNLKYGQKLRKLLIFYHPMKILRVLSKKLILLYRFLLLINTATCSRLYWLPKKLRDYSIKNCDRIFLCLLILKKSKILTQMKNMTE